MYKVILQSDIYHIHFTTANNICHLFSMIELYLDLDIVILHVHATLFKCHIQCIYHTKKTRFDIKLFSACWN